MYKGWKFDVSRNHREIYLPICKLNRCKKQPLATIGVWPKCKGIKGTTQGYYEIRIKKRYDGTKWMKGNSLQRN